MEIIDDAVVSTVSKNLVKVFRERGRLAQRTVDIDPVELANAIGISPSDYILALAVLAQEGSISISRVEPSLELEEACAEALAKLDYMYLTGELDSDKYRGLAATVWRLAGLPGEPALASGTAGGPGDEAARRFHARRLARLFRLLRTRICRLAEEGARISSKRRDEILLIAIIDEIAVLHGKVKRLASALGLDTDTLEKIRGEDDVTDLDSATVKAMLDAASEYRSYRHMVNSILDAQSRGMGDLIKTLRKIASSC